MKFLVIGGGIAGLSAAIALRLNGHEGVIFEQADKFEHVGAGLQISPNASRHLLNWGVNLDTAFAPEAIEMRMGVTGRKVFSLPMRDNAYKRWHAPYLHIHRGDLHAALLSKLKSLGGFEIRMNGSVQDIENRHIIDFDGERCDFLIAANGVHSRIRNQLFGDDRARFSGNVAWRATVPIEELHSPPPPSAVIWAGKKQHAVTTRICKGSLVNFVGITEEAAWQEEGWNHEVDPKLAKQAFLGWKIDDILEKAQQVYRWALLERDPLDHYHKGRVVLVGDAAHPMLPSLAQGACQAIEDAALLGKLAKYQFSPQNYSEARVKRATQIQNASKKALYRYHLGGFSQSLQYGAAFVAGKISPEILYRQFDWIYRA